MDPRYTIAMRVSKGGWWGIKIAEGESRGIREKIHDCHKIPKRKFDGGGGEEKDLYSEGQAGGEVIGCSKRGKSPKNLS